MPYAKKNKKHGRIKKKLFRKHMKPHRSIYHKDHFFTRSFDWADVYESQGNSFNGSYGLAANGSDGVSIAFAGQLLTISVPAATSGYTTFALSPMLQSLQNYSEFTSLYDMYRIHGFSTRVTPLQNNFMAPFTGTDGTNALYAIGGTCAILHTAMDWDDNQTFIADPAGVAGMREFLTYRWTALTGTGRGSFHKMYCKRPGVKIVTGSGNDDGGGNVISLIKRSPLLDCATPNINHHSQKFIFETSNTFATTASVYYFKVETKVWLNVTQPR